MTTWFRGAFCVAAVCLVGCGSPSIGTIAGKVLFSDADGGVGPAGGLTVSLVGGVGTSMPTSSAGAYSFEKLPDGVYLVSVDAPDTREHKLSVATEVKEGKVAMPPPDLTFNPTGSLTGKVTTSAMMPAVGATVYLSGSDRVALTDGAGAYRFSEIPVGDYTLVARADGAINQSAMASVKLKRGKNDGPALTLSDDLGVTGKLEGVIYYFNGDKPNGIKLSVADVTANTSDTGFFSLTLPAGTYSLVAEAAGYPKQTIGRFTVRAGETTSVPATPMTLYKVIPLFERGQSPTWMAISEGDTAILKLYNGADYYYGIYAIDLKAVDRKLLFLGNPNIYHLSKMGKWFAFQPSNGNGVAVINTANGKSYTFAGSSIVGPLISSDETVMMFWSAGQNLLYRVDLGTGAATTFTAFPGSFFQSNDRFLARSANLSPFDVQLITPTTSTSAFTAMTTLNRENPTVIGGNGISFGVVTYPLAWAYNCAVACAVQVLGTTANSSSPVSATVTSFPSSIFGTVRDWLGLSWGGVTPGKILVKVADGTPSTLPAATFQLIFNETQTRVVTYATNPGTFLTDLREDVVPPSASSPVLLTSPQSGAWISPTRFFAFSVNPMVRKLEIKTGVPTTDTDLVSDAAAQSPFVVPPAVMWLKTTTMKRVGIAYDSAEFPVDTIGAMSLNNFAGIGSRSSVFSSVLGKYAVIFDGASAQVFDGIKAEARKGPGVTTSSSNPMFVATDRFRNVPFGPTGGFAQGISLQFFETGKTQLVSEPSKTEVQVATLPKGAIAAASNCDNIACTLALALLP